MSDTEDERSDRLHETDEILSRKPGTTAVPDHEDRYRVVGAADRSTYADWLTPVEEHYVCHRNGTLDGDADDWTVSLTGDVDGVDLSLETLREEYPTVAVAHTMECAGNGRGYFDPETGSVQWEYGAVGTAFWTGTPVEAVLERNGAEGTWLTAIGADEPEDDDVFARSIPMAKATDDCILAYAMNGRPLPPEHGHPVRLLVPGWYGVNSVKWLGELRVMDRMVSGEAWRDRDGRDYTYWQQGAYRIHPEGVEPAENESVETFDTYEQWASGEVEHPYTFDENVKSTIGHPSGDEPVEVREDGNVEVVGVAWAGDDAVERVEVSTDGGDTWADARFVGPAYDGAWRLFRHLWDADPGTYTLCSRATDEAGRTQPRRISRNTDGSAAADEYPWNEGGYAENAYEPHAVEVTVR